MNKLLVPVMLVAVIALAVVVKQSYEISDLRKALEQRTVAEKLATVKPPEPARVARRETPPPLPLPPPVAPLVEEAPARLVAQSAPALPNPAAKQQPTMGEMFAGIGSMMTNPAMKEMIRQQSKMQLEMQFGRLFKFLNRSPEQVEALKAILMDRQMALMDGGMAFMTGGGSPEERKQKAKELQTVKESYDKKIAELLGTEDYDAFKQYENTQPERMQTEMFKSMISSSAEPLTEQQEYDLVNAMYSARTNLPATSLLNQKPDAPPDPSQFTPESIDQALKQSERLQAQYLASAQTILSAAQFQQFQQFATQQKQMTEMGMKFAAQMFGGAKAEPPPAPVPEKAP